MTYRWRPSTQSGGSDHLRPFPNVLESWGDHYLTLLWPTHSTWVRKHFRSNLGVQMPLTKDEEKRWHQISIPRRRTESPQALWEAGSRQEGPRGFYNRRQPLSRSPRGLSAHSLFPSQQKMLRSGASSENSPQQINVILTYLRVTILIRHLLDLWDWALQFVRNKHTRIASWVHHFICSLYNLPSQEMFMLSAFFLIAEWKTFYPNKSTSRISSHVKRRCLQKGPFLCTCNLALSMTRDISIWEHVNKSDTKCKSLR